MTRFHVLGWVLVVASGALFDPARVPAMTSTPSPTATPTCTPQSISTCRQEETITCISFGGSCLTCACVTRTPTPSATATATATRTEYIVGCCQLPYSCYRPDTALRFCERQRGGVGYTEPYVCDAETGRCEIRIPTPTPTPTVPLGAGQECAYVTQIGGVLAIDTADNAFTARVPLGWSVTGPLALTPNGSLALVGVGDGLDVIATERNRLVATIPMDIFHPGPIAFVPDGSVAYATGSYDYGAPARATKLFVIDVASRLVARTIDQAENAAVSPDGNTVYAIRTDVWLNSPEQPQLLFIDAFSGEITGTLPDVPYAGRIVVTSDGRSVYLGSTGYPDSRLIRVDADTRRVSGSIDVEGELTGLVLSDAGAIAYTTAYKQDIGIFTILDLATGTRMGTVTVEGVPDGLAMTRDQRRAYILLRPDIRRQDPAIGVIDVATRTMTSTIPLETWATSLDIAETPFGCGAEFCEGDCDSSGQVTVDELLKGVEISLGAPLDMCPAYVAADSGSLPIDALVRAINHLLNGCPEAAIVHTWI